MSTIQVRRLTRAKLDLLLLRGEVRAGEPILVTDELRVVYGNGLGGVYTRPAFSVSSSYGGGVTTAIPFDTVRLNDGGHYSTSTYRFTAPVAGLYQLASHILLASPAPAGEYRMALMKNGAEMESLRSILQKFTGAGYWTLGLSGLARLSAGEYVTVSVVQVPSGGTLWTDPNYNNFSGFLVD